MIHRCSTCGEEWITAHACKVPTRTIGELMDERAAERRAAIVREGYAAGIEAAAREIDCGGPGKCSAWVPTGAPTWLRGPGCLYREERCRHDMAERIRALAKESK